ncbi:MAG: hypothetical protein IT355_18950 [Gemmatimonadaceae bacterium]|nr:hypothetical protein [Gemmatimonadaceae bacterium]
MHAVAGIHCAGHGRSTRIGTRNTGAAAFARLRHLTYAPLRRRGRDWLWWNRTATTASTTLVSRPK